MDRRKSLKLIVTGAIAAPAAIAGCNTTDKEKTVTATEPIFNLDRSKDEIAYEKTILNQEFFFTPHEMATLHVLTDIIIPADEISASATEAKVPDFIEFIVKDMPAHQIPMRGGLRWVDIHCLKKFENAFKDCTQAQQMEMVDAIAWPEKAKPEVSQGVSFFNLLRNLTATGFYTSEIGVKDLGYAGNTPNQWDGVPDDILKQYNIAYSERELSECIKFDTK